MMEKRVVSWLDAVSACVCCVIGSFLYQVYPGGHHWGVASEHSFFMTWATCGFMLIWSKRP